MYFGYITSALLPVCKKIKPMSIYPTVGFTTTAIGVSSGNDISVWGD